ncbi:MAG: response regulator transcription factor [Bacteroidales bacterium]|nr:response regulator transcription factor [Bacteroidales bacterium]
MEIFIVEDHPVVAEGLQKLFAEEGICNNCPVAYSGKECLETLKIYTPQVIFLDINLPDVSGIDLCKTILDLYQPVKIIALSSFGSRVFIQKMLENGASGYLLKNADREEIIMAIKEVTSGKTYCSSAIKEILENKTCDGLPILTKREQEVLKLIAEGLTNNEIAERMFISPLTADSHRKNLLVKLGARNTASMVRIAMTHQLI